MNWSSSRGWHCRTRSASSSATILKLEQENQRLEAYLKILKRIDRRARVEVLRQAKDQQGKPANHDQVHRG
jgi:hypothetical protein